jgi:hypothetical protein
MKSFAQFREQAAFLRASSGSTNIEKTLLKALKVLKLFDIPHYVCGGFAVQELGYPIHSRRGSHCDGCCAADGEVVAEWV